MALPKDNDTKKPGLLKRLSMPLKLLIAGVIVYYVWHKFGREIVNGLKRFDLRLLAPAMLTYVSHMVICAWRWRKLAAVLGVRLGFGEALSLTFQGYFFSLVMPGGAIGGDVIKIGVVARRSPGGSKIEGAFTVLMDRIVGMIALFVLELILLYPASGILHKVQLGSWSGDVIIWLLFFLGVAGLGASCVIFFHKLVEKIPGMGALMNWGDKISGGMVRRLTSATDTYSEKFITLTHLTVISIFFVHIMTAIPLIFIMRGMNLNCGIFEIIVAVTVGNILGLIPLLPGGLGTRDFGIIALLTASGISRGDAAAACIIYTAILIFFNLSGGLFFLFDRGKPLQDNQGVSRPSAE